MFVLVIVCWTKWVTMSVNHSSYIECVSMLLYVNCQTKQTHTHTPTDRFKHFNEELKKNQLVEKLHA